MEASTAPVMPKLLAESRWCFLGQPCHLFHLFYQVHIRPGSLPRGEEPWVAESFFFGSHKHERTRHRPRPAKPGTKTHNENILSSATHS
jgi:hypothetical protein